MFRTVLERQTIHTIAYSTDGTFRSYGAKPRDPVDYYKHCIPTGFFVRLIVLVETRFCRLATQRNIRIKSLAPASRFCVVTSLLCRP